MSAQSPVDKNSPLWLAWQAYSATEDYANTKRWAVHPAHAEGSLWAAFEQGFRLATPASAPVGERSLTRYSMEPGLDGDLPTMEPDADGEWVRYDEAVAAIAARAAERRDQEEGR